MVKRCCLIMIVFIVSCTTTREHERQKSPEKLSDAFKRSEKGEDKDKTIINNEGSAITNIEPAHRTPDNHGRNQDEDTDDEDMIVFSDYEHKTNVLLPEVSTESKPAAPEYKEDVKFPEIPSESLPVEPGNKEYLSFGVNFGYLEYFHSQFNDYFFHSKDIGLFFNYIGKANFGLHCEFNFSIPSIKKNSLMDNSLSNITIINIGADIRNYFARRSNFFSPFMGIGFQYVHTAFNYKNQVYADYGDREELIKNDNIPAYRILLVGGCDLIRIKRFHLSLNAKFGFTMYNGVSDKGFINDVFPDSGTLEIGLDIGYGI